MKKAKIIAGIFWALICLILILFLFPGLNSFSGSVSKLSFMKINPRYTGGEVVNKIVTESCTLDIRKPVFNGLFRDRNSGFVQIDWRGEVPEFVKDTIDYNGDGQRDFCISVNRKEDKTDLETFSPEVQGVVISTPTSYGWAARIGLLKTSTSTLTCFTMRPVVYMSFVFALSELLLMIIKRSDRATSRTRNDRGSMIFLWLMITIGFTCGFFLSKPVNHLRAVFGLSLIIGGIIVRWAAILQLGKSFTVDVAITNAADLKTDGIYKRIRHPSYSGILMIIIGFSTIMSSLYSILVLVIPVFTAIIYRINIEEKVLMNEFGESYRKYRSETKKLIPFFY